MPDYELIRKILKGTLPTPDETEWERRPASELLKPRAGSIAVEEPAPIKDADAAFKRFFDFGGVGWLQSAHTPEILHGDGNTFSQQIKDRIAQDGCWPVTGERFNEDTGKSLHLRRTSEGWVFTEFTEGNTDPDGVLMTHRLLSADLKEYLKYEVHYQPVEIGGHEELRPVASRFIGFEPAPNASPSKKKQPQENHVKV